MTGIHISEDEVGYIAIHIHAGLSEENVAQALDMARLVQESVALIEREMKAALKTDSLGHNRLVSHLRYMIARTRKGEPLNLDMEAYAREQFPGPYRAALGRVPLYGRTDEDGSGSGRGGISGGSIFRG